MCDKLSSLKSLPFIGMSFLEKAMERSLKQGILRMYLNSRTHKPSFINGHSLSIYLAKEKLEQIQDKTLYKSVFTCERMVF